MASDRRRRLVAPIVAAVLAVALGVGGWLGLGALGRAVGWLTDGGSPTIGSEVFAPPESVADDGIAAIPAAGRSAEGSIAAAQLAGLIDDLPQEGADRTTWVVLDAESGESLAGSGASKALIPASTMKLLTALTVIDLVPQHETFATTVVRTADNSIVLVGGGDPLLMSDPDPDDYPSFASLSELAELTADALDAAGQTKVRVDYDASLFTGSGWTSRWEDVFRPYQSPVSALTVDRGYPEDSGTPSTDPALLSAKRFAGMLEERGITVSGTPASVAADGTEIARVESPTALNLMRQALLTSDNIATETMLRHAALAQGKEGSFSGAWATLEGWLDDNGLLDDKAVISDGSGVSRANKVTATMLAKAARLIATDPQFQPLIDGLPVSGVSGTLHDRFEATTATSARGTVWAKTGTLRDVSTLAGFTTTADGQVVAFAFMANNYTNYFLTKTWIDSATATVASCGCR